MSVHIYRPYYLHPTYTAVCYTSFYNCECMTVYITVDNVLYVKVGFHYPSSRAELTARELG